jgi:hypothetical protein
MILSNGEDLMKILQKLLTLSALLALPIGAYAQTSSSSSAPADKPAQTSSDNGGIKDGIKKDAKAVENGTKKAWTATKNETHKAVKSVEKGAHTAKTDASHALKNDGSTSVNKPVGGAGTEPTSGTSGH